MWGRRTSCTWSSKCGGGQMGSSHDGMPTASRMRVLTKKECPCSNVPLLSGLTHLCCHVCGVRCNGWRYCHRGVCQHELLDAKRLRSCLWLPPVCRWDASAVQHSCDSHPVDDQAHFQHKWQQGPQQDRGHGRHSLASHLEVANRA